MLGEYPSLSRLGTQAKLIIGGGPHMRITVPSSGAGRFSLIIWSLTNPELYFQSTNTTTILSHWRNEKTTLIKVVLKIGMNWIVSVTCVNDSGLSIKNKLCSWHANPNTAWAMDHFTISVTNISNFSQWCWQLDNKSELSLIVMSIPAITGLSREIRIYGYVRI